jgi:hypothetical protein
VPVTNIEQWRQLIAQRRAELQRAALGPIDDSLRAKALSMFVAKGTSEGASQEDLDRLARLAAIRGDDAQEWIAVAKAKRAELAQSRRTAVPPDAGDGDTRLGAPPEGRDAPIPEGHAAPIGEAIVEPMSTRPLPAVPPQPAWYEGRKWRAGLQRADQLKRLWSKPDTSPDRGSGWMKR